MRSVPAYSSAFVNITFTFYIKPLFTSLCIFHNTFVGTRDAKFQVVEPSLFSKNKNSTTTTTIFHRLFKHLVYYKFLSVRTGDGFPVPNIHTRSANMDVLKERWARVADYFLDKQAEWRDATENYWIGGLCVKC